MTTTKLIELLKQNEFGGATGRPREISFTVNGRFIPEPTISVNSSGDGLFSELGLELRSEKEYEETEEDDECDDIALEFCSQMVDALRKRIKETECLSENSYGGGGE